MGRPHGHIAWNELMTRDLDAAKRYYGAICGWTFEDMPMPGGPGTYTIASAGGQMVAGLFDMTGHEGMEGVPPTWFTYVEVADVDAAVADTAAAGGTVQRPPFDIPGTGRIAVVTDASGAAVGLMTSAPMEGA